MTKNIDEDHNPMQQFQKWFCEAGDIYDEQEPNAMSITTIGDDNFPKSRMVLLKKYTWEGFVFFTNYNSEKGKALNNNSKVCILFNWVKSGRMIEVRGEATKISKEESTNYFNQRPRGSQLGAWASQQSDVVKSREELENQLARLENQYEGQEIPKPEFWGGYMIKPQEFHFYESKNQNTKTEVCYVLQPDFYWSKD